MEVLYCDYLVIGAGAAGCVVANRLSKNNTFSVLCIEAGGDDNNPFIKIPAGFSKTVYNKNLNWSYVTAPSKSSIIGTKKPRSLPSPASKSTLAAPSEPHSHKAPSPR